MTRALIAIAFVAAACAPAPAPAPAPRTPTPLTIAPTADALAALERAPDLDGTPLGPAADAPATLVISFASWCEHCHDELHAIASLRAAHPTVRLVGLNYRGHEDYGGRGGDRAVRAYVATNAPWLRVIPADDALFAAFGQPPKIPTIFVYDRAGHLAATFDVRTRRAPTAGELDQLLAGLELRDR